MVAGPEIFQCGPVQRLVAYDSFFQSACIACMLCHVDHCHSVNIFIQTCLHITEIPPPLFFLQLTALSYKKLKKKKAENMPLLHETSPLQFVISSSRECRTFQHLSHLLPTKTEVIDCPYVRKLDHFHLLCKIPK